VILLVILPLFRHFARLPDRGSHVGKLIVHDWSGFHLNGFWTGLNYVASASGQTQVKIAAEVEKTSASNTADTGECHMGHLSSVSEVVISRGIIGPLRAFKRSATVEIFALSDYSSLGCFRAQVFVLPKSRHRSWMEPASLNYLVVDDTWPRVRYEVSALFHT